TDGDLLEREEIGQRVEAQSVVLLGDEHAEKAEGAELLRHAAIEPRLAIPLGRVRCQLVARESPRELDDLALLVRERRQLSWIAAFDGGLGRRRGEARAHAPRRTFAIPRHSHLPAGILNTHGTLVLTSFRAIPPRRTSAATGPDGTSDRRVPRASPRGSRGRCRARSGP